MNHARLLALSFVLGLATACSSTSPLSDGGTSDAGAPSDAEAAGNGCDGKTSSGILGTFRAELLGGGDPPNGSKVVTVTQRYRFCGTQTSGTFRYTAEALHYVGRNCELVTDVTGTFTYDGKVLAVTSVAGNTGTKNCAIPSQAQLSKVTEPWTDRYDAVVSAAELSLRVVGSTSEPVVHRRE